MKRCTVRLGLSLMLAVGWWVQRLPAQAPIAPAPAAPVPVALAPVVMAPAQAPCCGDSADGLPPGEADKTRLRRMLNKCGLGCFTTHNVPGCGSLHSELTFMFGSCRAFFGEPCFAAPPPRGPLPVPAYGAYGH